MTDNPAAIPEWLLELERHNARRTARTNPSSTQSDQPDEESNMTENTLRVEDAAGDALAETTTEPDLATAIDALTSQLRELVEASVHQLLVLQTDEGDDLAQRFADEMVGRVNYADDGPAWDAFLAAIRAERG